MNPSDWISLGALAVALASVIGASIIAPWKTAQYAHGAQLREARREIYADAIRLMRARLQEIENRQGGLPIHDAGPGDDEAAMTTAQMLLYASKGAFKPFETFFREYWMSVPSVPKMRRALDESVDGMRRDVGTAPWLEPVPATPDL
jgi:hypothetical protein